MTYSLINYFDVWGNEIDGWEINDQCIEKTGIEIPYEMDNDQILNMLKRINFLNSAVTNDYFEITNYGELVEINVAENGCPICALMEEIV